jgi:hypothetical protein
LYLASAFFLALILVGIGFIPTRYGSTRLIYESFGAMFIVYIGAPIFGAFQPIISHLPPWSIFVLLIAVGAVYTLLLTVPLYFFFRTRRPALLFLQALLLAAHGAIARFIIAPHWVHG